MTQPREALASIADTPYYHLISRCVRRTFLCGVDHTTGKNHEHRRQWIEDRLRILSSLFAIDLCCHVKSYPPCDEALPTEAGRFFRAGKHVFLRWGRYGLAAELFTV